MLKAILRVSVFSVIILITSSYINSGNISDHRPDLSIRNPFVFQTHTQWIDSIMDRMDLEEKIAQLFMVAAYSNRDENHTDEILTQIKKYHIGGLIFFQGSPVKQAEMTNRFQEKSRVPLLIAMDAEWGLGMRLDSTVSYPRQLMLGALQNDSMIFHMANDISRQLKRIGVQVSFAPVVDVNNNPDNPVINSRSFGENKYNVAAKGLAYMKGLMDNRILPTAKHFPGHGDTGSDSHYTLPVIPYSAKRLDTLELFPFKYLINNGLNGIMVAHLSIPAFDSAVNIPASLSQKIVQNVLQDSMGYQGLIFTDALGMEGVKKYYEPGQIELKALLAGNDILLMPPDIPKAISLIKKAIKDGLFPKEEIDRRCRKVLAAKQWTGLDHYKPVKLENLTSDLNNPAYEVFKRKLISSSITVVTNKDSLLPVTNLDTLNIATLSIGTLQESPFQKSLGLYAPVKNYHIDKDAPQTQWEAFLKILSQYDLIIIGNHDTDRRPSKDFGISPKAVSFINELAQHNKVILDVFANPYALAKFKGLENLQSVIVSYNEDSITEDLSAQIIFGGQAASGRLPVSADSLYISGIGQKTQKIRLGYSIPESAGLSSTILERIDSIATDAIDKKATPGCQILVAKNGEVVYYKSFGYHTYMENIPVKNTDIYDLASITKIGATTPALMKLYDEGKFEINGKLEDYLPSLDTTNKGNIKISDVLTHQAQLQPWIPFYLDLLQCGTKDAELFSKSYSDQYPIKLAGHFYANRNIFYKPGVISESYSDSFNIQIADHMYLLGSYRDTIFNKIADSKLLKKKEYKYSDLGFYLFYKIVEKQSSMPFYNYVYYNFYKPLGASTLGFLPLNRFDRSRIVPTENDLIFRRQLIQGYVHDPGAAMLGGISGHAGLFSDANDLAKLMQMFMQDGNYGGKTYLKPETVELFTSCQHCKKGNRRGLGFDKPEMDYSKEGPTCQCVPASSFGHTGFTGTMAWADPDNQIVYIFLSNRVHPSQDNNKLVSMDVRTKIQQVIYDAMR